MGVFASIVFLIIIFGNLAFRTRMTTEPPPFALDHPCGLLIRRELDESAAEALVDVRKHDMRTGYVWYYLPKAVMRGERVAISVCFHQRRLDWVRVEFDNPERYGSPLGADWSESKERLRAADTGRWLADAGWPVGTYSWGVVYAEYSLRDGYGDGGVKFVRPPSS